MAIQKDRVKLNVGGKIFETTATTLANAGRNSFFGAILLDDNWSLRTNNSDEYFINQNPKCFAVLLDLLRTGELHIPSNVPEKLLYREARFYGLLDHVRAAKWGRLDGNRLHFSSSITGTSPYDGTLVRASPDGGCCVAQGSVIRVYDWMLEEHPPINLGYKPVNDVCWINSETLVVSTASSSEGKSHQGSGSGGLAMFSASTSDLKHRFEMDGLKPGALTSSPDNKLFSSCRGSGNKSGIGVWDQVTGKLIEFYSESDGGDVDNLIEFYSETDGCDSDELIEFYRESDGGDAGKLQWLPGTNCLMVASFVPKMKYGFIRLVDFREKQRVWCWSDERLFGREHKRVDPYTRGRVRDAIAMEDAGSISVVNDNGYLGFLDLRKVSSDVSWFSKTKTYTNSFPKLVLCKGQLFVSMNHSISVFSGPDWVLTSRLSRSFGDSICDLSVGGDRLFALHSKENVFDILETPPPPIS